MNTTTVYSIPLAPPAHQSSVRRVEKNTAPIAVTWKEWLSPKLVSARRHRQQQQQQQQPQHQCPQDRYGTDYRSDDDDDHDDAAPRTTLKRRQQQRRNRSASFDLAPMVTNRTRFSNAVNEKDSGLLLFGGAGRISKSVYAFGDSNSKTHRDDELSDGARDNSLHSSHSFLTTFLLRLDSCLPEYCMHLSSTSEDTLLSIAEASKAVDVLEKKSNIDTHMSNYTTTKGDRGAAKFPSPSPILQSSSPSKGHGGKSPVLSILAPSSPAHRWLSPLQQQTSTGGLASKWNAKAETEWERFASPFLNLIAAECLYTRMEHVLDPSKCFSSTVAGGREESSSNVMKGVNKSSEKKTSVRVAARSSCAIPPPPLSPANDSKLGSRRLITIYRQIREELVIVGEYLVDPVIGTRAAGGGATSLSAVSSECNTVLEQREFAATSFRTTLDALISFIDARVVLIRIHAELCFFQAPLYPHLLKDEGSHDLCGQSSKKWIALAQQCRAIKDPVCAFVANEKEVCIPQRAVSNITKELKCLELLLTAIGNLLACDLFNCVVNIRRLHVLLGNISHRRKCLPILYVAASLPELLAIMRIYFSELRNGKSISPRPSLTTTSLRSTLSERLSSNRNLSLRGKSNKSTDFASLFSEFIVGANSDIDLPLAVALVRRMRPSSLEEGQQGEDAKESKHPDSSWKPLFMKCRGVNHDGRSLSLDMGTGAKTGESNPDDANSSKGQEIDRWPLNHWTQIEQVLTKHCSAPATTDPVKHTIISAVAAGGFVRPNDIDAKFILSMQSLYGHVIAITDLICLIVIQGVGGRATRQEASNDKEIQDFLRCMASRLSPENLFGLRAVMHLKSEVFAKAVEDNKEHPCHRNHEVQMTSLWSESNWSNDQGKKVLHSLGLRSMSSPVIAPLKSPYVKRKIRGGRQRMKHMKSSWNHGHLDFFLGPELSNLPIPSEFDFDLLNRK